MKILVLAPHPFYQERGTPIAVDLLVRALSERGDSVDVLTFHEGSDRHYDRVAIHRIKPRLFALRDVRPGPSAKKLLCDLYLFGALIARLRRQRYDVIHAVEESAFMAMLVRPFTATPFLYDMDSSLATQVVDKYPWMRPVAGILRFLESLPVRRAAAVVPVCEALARHVARYRTQDVTILKDVSLLGPVAEGEDIESLRETMGIHGPLSMYIGNLERYQGIDLMLEAFAQVCRRLPDAHLAVIGGEPADIQHYRDRARSLGIAPSVHFLGKRPVSNMGGYMCQADTLVSPRTQGVNTPMKVYSYLDSGVAVVATDLPTHTQVMTPEIAALAPPNPDALAETWLGVLSNPEERARLATNARALIRREHSYEAFRNTLHGLYAQLDHQLPAAATIHGGRP